MIKNHFWYSDFKFLIKNITTSNRRYMGFIKAVLFQLCFLNYNFIRSKLKNQESLYQLNTLLCGITKNLFLITVIK